MKSSATSWGPTASFPATRIWGPARSANWTSLSVTERWSGAARPRSWWRCAVPTGLPRWLEDGQFPLIRYVPKIPLPPGTPDAQVELGFWGIYRTLALTDTGGAPLGAVADALPAILGPADAVVVSGHSLGAPLATYLTLDLVSPGFA